MANSGSLKLGNFVWDDKNANGIQDAGELGLANVTVNLQFLNGTNWTSYATTQTNSTGFYQFPGVSDENFRMQFVLPAGYIFTSKGNSLTDDTNSDVNPATGYTDTFTLDLSGNGDNDYVDAGVYKTGSISSRVWHDQDADGVQDASEAGLANVTVNLYSETGTTLVQTVMSLADGSYSFSNVVPGKYKLQFVNKAGYNYSPQDVDTTSDELDSDADANGYTGIYTVTSNGLLNNIAAGMHQLVSIGNKVWLDTNTTNAKDANGIQDAGETGVAGIVVNAYQAGVLKGSATTAADGSYKIDKLQPGSYEIEFVKTDAYLFTRPNAGANEVLDSDANPNTGRASVTVAAGQNHVDLDAGLYPKDLSLKLGDQVWNDSNANGLQDEASLQGIANVNVKLYDMSNNGVLVAQRTTDASGKYLFTEVLPGDYKVQFGSVAGYGMSPALQGSDRSKDSDAASDGVTAVFNMTADNLTVDAGMKSVPVGSIQARLWHDVDYDGIQDSTETTNITNATVQLFKTSDLNTVVATATVDTSNEYAFNNVAVGEYVLKFIRPTAGDFAISAFTKANVGSDESTDSDANTSSGWSQNFTVAANDKISYVDAGLIKGATIGDRVWLDKDGNGIQKLNLGGTYDSSEPGVANVTLTLWAADGSRAKDVTGKVLDSVITDANGLYQFKNVMPGNGYEIQLSNYSSTLSPTTQDAGNDSLDSDFKANGWSNDINVKSGDTVITVDAGLKVSQKISGSVWHDKIQTGDKYLNGVWDSNESGLAGATVTLQLRASDGKYYDVNDGVRTTDANGNYNFGERSVGDYRLDFNKDSYLLTYQDQASDDSKDSDADQKTGLVSFSLSAGVDVDMDAGMALKARIGDVLWQDHYDSKGNEVAVDGLQKGTRGSVGDAAVIHLQSLRDGTVTSLASMKHGGGGYYGFNVLPGEYRLYAKTIAGCYATKANVGKNGEKTKADGSIYYYDQDDSDFSSDYYAGSYNESPKTHATKWFSIAEGVTDNSWDGGFTPIVIDLNSDGVQTVARSDNSPSFDLLGNGTKLQSGWVSAQDGFLTIDKDGNGTIDSINELFGGLNKGDGFAKLADFDSNGDGVVDVNDARFAELKIWVDADGDRVTDAGELLGLVDAGIASLKVSYIEIPELDANGNLHLERSSATLTDGTVVDMTDVYFNVDGAAAASVGVTLPSMDELLGDTSLDSLFGPTSPSSVIVSDNSGNDAQTQLAKLLNLDGVSY